MTNIESHPGVLEARREVFERIRRASIRALREKFLDTDLCIVQAAGPRLRGNAMHCRRACVTQAAAAAQRGALAADASIHAGLRRPTKCTMGSRMDVHTSF